MQTSSDSTTDVKSLPELLFHAHSTGEITTKDYQVQTAAWVADNKGKFSPRPLFSPSQIVKDYMRERTLGMTQYDSFKSKATGDWLIGYTRAVMQNSADANLLLWSAEKLNEEGLVSASEKCLRGFEEHAAHKPDTELVRMAKQTKELDAAEPKQSGARNSHGN